MSRAVIYCRVSTQGQAKEDSTSLAVQFAACHNKAQQIGARVVASFEDIHSGADYHEREGLQQALSLLESNDADTLIIYDMSRYSRDLAHQQLIKKRVQACGAKLVFCTFEVGNLNDPETHLSFGVTGIFAEYERLKTRDRVMKGKIAKVEQGIQVSRSYHPYGYRIVTKDDVIERLYEKEQIGKYVIIEEQAKLVRWMFETYAQGSSLREVCRHLTLHGPPSPRNGREWNEVTVRRILSNPVYRGKATFGRKIRVIDETRTARGLSKQTYRKVAPDKIHYIEAPPVVSEELWNRVQEKFDENRRLFAGKQERRWALSGLLRCPICGSAMGGRYFGDARKDKRLGRPKQTDYFYYRCRATFQRLDASKHCQAKGIKARVIEETVYKELLKYAANPEALEGFWVSLQEKSRGARSKTTLEETRAQLATIRRKESAIVEAQIKSIEAGASSVVYETKLRELCEQRDALESIVAQMEGQHTEHSRETLKRRSIAVGEALEKIKDVITSPLTEPQEKRNLLAEIILRIIPKDTEGKKVEIIFKDFESVASLNCNPPDASIQMLASGGQQFPALPNITKDAE